MAKRTDKEMRFRRLCDSLGVNFRFHRLQGAEVGNNTVYMVHDRCGSASNNKPRRWTFEWWKRAKGDPLNESKNSELNCIGVDKGVLTKDEAVEWVLFESGFLRDAALLTVSSWEELSLKTAVAGFPEPL